MKDHRSVRLKRSIVSRLIGDRWIAEAPSQVLALVMLVLPEKGMLGWLVFLVLMASAIPAFLWSARVYDGKLICSVLGFTTREIDLRGCRSATINVEASFRGGKIWSVLLRDCQRVSPRKGESGELTDPQTEDILLKYTRGLSQRRCREWVTHINHAARSRSN